MKPEVEFSCTTKKGGGAVIFYCAGMRQALPRQFYNENTINKPFSYLPFPAFSSKSFYVISDPQNWVFWTKICKLEKNIQ